MADPNATPTETFSETTGLTEVDPESFLTEDEGHVEEQDGTDTEVEDPSNQTDPENKDKAPSNTNPDGEDKGDKPDAEPSTQVKPEDTVLLAGKYKNLDDLKAAFVELGGDPDDYSDQKMLEEAYKVRQAEWTRVHQQRTQETVQTDPTPPETPQTVEDMVEDIVKNTDLSKATNAGALFKIAVEAVMKKVVPMVEAAKQAADPEQLANTVGEKISKQSAEYNARMTELREVETKVPRLRTDKKFRDNFADFVAGKKLNHSYTDLNSAMKDFLGGKDPISDPAQAKKNEEDKNSAAGLPDNSGGATDTPETDEVDDIISEYKTTKEKFGN